MTFSHFVRKLNYWICPLKSQTTNSGHFSNHSQVNKKKALSWPSHPRLASLWLSACGERLYVWNARRGSERRGRGNPGADSLSYSLTRCQSGYPVPLTLITGDRAKCQAPHMTMMTLEKILPIATVCSLWQQWLCPTWSLSRAATLRRNEMNEWHQNEWNDLFIYFQWWKHMFCYLFFAEGFLCYLVHIHINKDKQTDRQPDRRRDTPMSTVVYV